MKYYVLRNRETGELLSFSGTRVSSSSPRLYATRGKAEGANCHRLFNRLPGSWEYDKSSLKGKYEVIAVTLEFDITG